MATLARCHLVVQDDAGNIVDGATITVVNELTLAPGAAYSDRSGSSLLGSEFVAADGADAGFHIAGGAYKITATKGAFSRTWRYVAVGRAAESDAGSVPEVTVDNTLPRFDGANGQLQTSDVSINDDNDIAIDGTNVLSLPSGFATSSLFVGNGGDDLLHTTGLEGQYNTSVGIQALLAITTGSYNDALGFESLYNLTTGTRNVGLGEATLFSIVSAVDNVGVGTKAGLNITSDSNVLVGSSAGINLTSGGLNTAIGASALAGGSGATAARCNAFGYQAGSKMTSGSDSLFIGYQAGVNQTTGLYNVLVGNQTGNAIVGTVGAVMIGHGAGGTTAAGNFNIGIGFGALTGITTGLANIHIGYSTADLGITTGNFNVLIGNVLTSLGNVSNNVVIGDGEGKIRWRASAATDIKEFASNGTTVLRTLTEAGVQSILLEESILTGTAIPAGGTAGKGYKFSSTANFGVFFGSGAPSLSAAKGSLYLRSDGTTTNDRAYINTNGGTTWTALTTVA